MFAVVDPRRPDLTTEAVLAGMADVFARPLGGRRVANAIERELRYEVASTAGAGDEAITGDLYSHSPAMRDVMALVNRAATMRAGVLIRAIRSLWTHRIAEIRQRSTEVMNLVGIDPVHLGSYPHQLSGGMRQRAMIAMALLYTPQLVIMDEPTSALDVVAQRSLMTQDQGSPAEPRVRRHLRHPRHVGGQPLLRSRARDVRGPGRRGGPDRRDLRAAAAPVHPRPDERVPDRPRPAPRARRDPGSPPDLARPPGGCRFHPRCPEVMPACLTHPPELYPVDDAQVRCLLYAEQADEAV